MEHRSIGDRTLSLGVQYGICKRFWLLSPIVGHQKREKRFYARGRLENDVWS